VLLGDLRVEPTNLRKREFMDDMRVRARATRSRPCQVGTNDRWSVGQKSKVGGKKCQKGVGEIGGYNSRAVGRCIDECPGAGGVTRGSNWRERMARPAGKSLFVAAAAGDKTTVRQTDDWQ
jgi:hypothetical protein